MSEGEENVSEPLDLAEALGATDSSGLCFSVYVPNKDREGNEIGNQRQWVLELIRMLSEMNGGATAMPPAEGGWVGDNGVIVWEKPVVVYSFVQTERFLASLPQIREFLHRMGRETKQGEIAFQFGTQFYRIQVFDPA